MSTTEIELPSGATLKVTLAPFKDGKALYQAVAEEMKEIEMDATQAIDANFFKGLFCVALSSRKIEAAVSECMKRATYNGLKITDQTWEPEEARQDYVMACYEVARVNILPFAKSLYAKYSQVLDLLKGSAQA